MFRILIATLAAVSLAGIGTADAAAKKKKARHVAPAPAIAAPAYPYYARTPGPVWASPNECYHRRRLRTVLALRGGQEQLLVQQLAQHGGVAEIELLGGGEQRDRAPLHRLAQLVQRLTL